MSNLPCAHAHNLSLLYGIRHGFFGRRGGVSTGIYTSLNVGPGSGDDLQSVRKNRNIVSKSVGARHLLSCRQQHSAKVVTVTRAWGNGGNPVADAMVTQQPGLALCVLSADCVPVLFADAKSGIVGAAHAGWKGAFSGVCMATIRAMEALGALRARITAAIGPAIQQASYEVSTGFCATFTGKHAWSADLFRHYQSNDRVYFDLPGYVHMQLTRAGLCHVEQLEHDTYTMSANYFSCRYCKHHGWSDYGRNGSVIMLHDPA